MKNLTEEERTAAWTARLIVAAVLALAAMYAARPEPPPDYSQLTPADSPSAVLSGVTS